jgi:hypothetical protein
MRALACAAGVVGGLCWVLNFVVEIAALHWAGLVLLAVTALLAGLASVPKAPTWLQAIVGVGSVGLFVSVVITLWSELADTTVDLVLGAGAVVVFGYLAAKQRGSAGPARQVGSHAR